MILVVKTFFFAIMSASDPIPHGILTMNHAEEEQYLHTLHLPFEKEKTANSCLPNGSYTAAWNRHCQAVSVVAEQMRQEARSAETLARTNDHCPMADCDCALQDRADCDCDDSGDEADDLSDTSGDDADDLSDTS